MVRRTVLAIAALALLPTAAPASAHYRYFHMHTNAYPIYQGAPYNCQYGHWSDHLGACTGWTEPSTNAGSFSGWTRVTWCGPANMSWCGMPEAYRNDALPAHYSRWMYVCHLYGNSECADWILGAVKMPNGPFRIWAGHFEGHSLTRSGADESRVSHSGEPLFLHVGYWGHISQGGGVPAKQGYVFGLRGYLGWDD